MLGKDTGMKFCCASNVGLKNVKIARKKNFFPKMFLTKSSFFQNLQILRKNKIYFWILEVLPVIFTIYLPV